MPLALSYYAPLPPDMPNRDSDTVAAAVASSGVVQSEIVVGVERKVAYLVA